MRKLSFWLLAVGTMMLFAGAMSVCAEEVPPPPGVGDETPAAAPAPAPAPAPEAPGAKAPAAPEASSGSTAEVKTQSYLSLVVKQSGIPGWTIILLSMVAIALWFKFGFQFSRKKLMPVPLIETLDQYFKEKKIKEAVELCNSDNSVLSRIVGASLAEIRSGYSEMEKVLEETTEEESVKMHQELSWLSLIGAITPMLGLLGTVMGMVGAFAKIAVSGGQPKPAELAGNIQFALITTVEGLVVAIPCLTAYAIFRNRVIKLVLEVAVVATGLLGRFKNVQITPAMLAGVGEGGVQRGKPAAGAKPPVAGAPGAPAAQAKAPAGGAPPAAPAAPPKAPPAAPGGPTPPPPPAQG